MYYIRMMSTYPHLYKFNADGSMEHLVGAFPSGTSIAQNDVNYIPVITEASDGNIYVSTNALGTCKLNRSTNILEPVPELNSGSASYNRVATSFISSLFLSVADLSPQPRLRQINTITFNEEFNNLYVRRYGGWELLPTMAAEQVIQIIESREQFLSAAEFQDLVDNNQVDPDITYYIPLQP
jgi:hypothetical protein